MTLIVAAAGKEMIVVGVDSMGTFGYGESSHIVIEAPLRNKLKIVSDHVCLLIAGDILGESIAEEFMRKVRAEKLDGASKVFNEFRQFCIGKWKEWFISADSIPAKEKKEVEFIIAGLDKEGEQFKIPKIFKISSDYSFAPRVYNHGFTCCGIEFLATYILSRGLKRDMERKDLCPLIAHSISETALIDGRVGGTIRIGAIETSSTIDTIELDQGNVKGMITEKKNDILACLRTGK